MPEILKSQLQNNENLCNNCHQLKCECPAEICPKCEVFTKYCSCPQICQSCKQIRHFNTSCHCDNEHILALKSKLEKAHQFSQKSLSQDCIAGSDQLDVTQQAEQLFDRFSVIPPEPGTDVNLDHCSPEIRTSLLGLIKTYDKAFAASKYDCGYFRGLSQVSREIP